MKLENYIESIPDFPKPGTLFYDLSPLIESPQAWKLAIDKLCRILEGSKINMVYGIEARGFLVASAVALKLGIGMQMVRKKGKLPGATVALTYDLEYGTDTIEIQNRRINYNNRVAIV
ncbi:MAG: adenine phosphoribosyltransferase, partial [Rhodospirillaceae bacterium]|nr:adenine phosphoribosyltransferase [Rhodospirillaceae bacterium]